MGPPKCGKYVLHYQAKHISRPLWQFHGIGNVAASASWSAYPDVTPALLIPEPLLIAEI